MSESLHLIPESVALTCKDLQVDPQELVISKEISAEEQKEMFRQKLTRVIQYLLDQDFNRLLNALYRIDVSERKVKEVINLAYPDQIAPLLADLVIEREMKKAEIRRKYSQGGSFFS